jgi:NAD+ diphosphatase
LSVAGKGADGKVSVIRQEVIRSPHADREKNMRLFADSAANIATEVVSGTNIQEADEGIETAQALLLDRATHLRGDAQALSDMEPTAKYVLLKGQDILTKSNTDLALLSQGDVQALGCKNSRQTFLGLLSDTGTAVFGIDLLAEDEVAGPSGTSFVNTRTTAPLFSSIENELALHATALAQWQRRTSFCNLCGAATMFVDGGTCCRCTKCNTPSWPRPDPSMIAVISSRKGDKVLLAHSTRHPPKFHTVLAGFVEAGETFEAAVAREAYEETGIRIDEGSVEYVGSQPWPFPQSCMIGFTATADCSQELNVDTNELVSAGWFDKADVAQAATVEGPTMQLPVAEAALQKDPSLPLLIPPKGVIARKLIDTWLST